MVLTNRLEDEGGKTWIRVWWLAILFHVQTWRGNSHHHHHPPEKDHNYGAFTEVPTLRRAT